MTLKEFFAKARKVKWTVKDGAVRTVSRFVPRGAHSHTITGHMCPLAYVTRGNWGPELAGIELGLGEKMGRRIATAADNPGNSQAWLKRQLGIAR